MKTQAFFMDVNIKSFAKDFIISKRNPLMDCKIYKYYDDYFLTVIKEIEYFEDNKFIRFYFFINDFNKYYIIEIENKKELLYIKEILNKIKNIKFNLNSFYYAEVDKIFESYNCKDFRNVKFIIITNKNDELIAELENLENKFYISKYKDSFLNYYKNFVLIEDIYFLINKCKQYKYTINFIYKNN